jgi:hypothetical protein
MLIRIIKLYKNLNKVLKTIIKIKYYKMNMKHLEKFYL